MSSRTLEIAREGMLHVSRRPGRSLLTALTSAIAIAVTVNVISLSFGFEEDIRGTVDLFGRRTVDVSRLPVLMPGMSRPSLGVAEERRIRERLADLDATVVGRRQVAATVAALGAGSSGKTSGRMSLLATAPDYLATLSVPLAAGRWLQRGDPDGALGEGVCVLDRAAAQRRFPTLEGAAVIGRLMSIDVGGVARRMRVIGLLADPMAYRELFEAFDEGRGARTLTSGMLSFRNVYVPASVLAGEEYTGISIAVASDADVETVRQRLLGIWPLDAHDLPSLMRGGIGVFVRRDWMEALGATTREGSLIGNLVWIFVILVAAVMISTLNLITIRERYDEIALRRCEGARRRDVALQITAEGTLLSLVGGLAGLPLGYMGATLLREIVGFPFRFELRFAVMATGVAVLLGLLSSVVPAGHAARLQPARVLGGRLR